MALLLNRRDSNTQILAAGRNCWSSHVPVDRCGLLIDARQYYRTFYEAACGAERYILIAGWKFNSDVRLVRGRDAVENGGEVKLLPFLKALCQRNHDLRVYVLAWDFSLLFVFTWEWFLDQKFDEPDGRIQFRFDDRHAFGASHHQKFAVIDGHTAFVGGLDFNADDWDDRDHKPRNSDRADSGFEPHGPYHDIQACLTGDAATELARYFQKRWQAAGNEPFDLPPARSVPIVRPALPIDSTRVALSRNEPHIQSQGKPVLEIRNLYADAIAAAEKLIYIENQYFTADLVGEVLERRMRESRHPRLDIVLLLPKQLAGWLESLALEPPRLRLLESLGAAARETGHRLGVYYSATTAADGTEVPTLIHSKLLIVDDRFLTVGSANTSNRSMALDSELNVSWEAISPLDAALAESIRRVRISLLAEHCGFRNCPEKIRELTAAEALVDYLDGLTEDRSHRLRHLTTDEILRGKAWLAHAVLSPKIIGRKVSNWMTNPSHANWPRRGPPEPRPEI